MEPLLQELIPKLETWIEETRQVFLDDLMELARIPSVACQSDGEYPYGEACARVLEKGGEGRFSGANGLFTVDVAKADGELCPRCWAHSDSVGADAKHPTLCARCAQIIG